MYAHTKYILKGFATFWELSFFRQKRVLIMNITVFLLNKFIFILNFSYLMCSNLGLFPQTWGLSTENNWILNLYFIKSIIIYTFLLTCTHIVHMKNLSIVCYRDKKFLDKKILKFLEPQVPWLEHNIIYILKLE